MIVVDAGNTRIKIAFFVDDKIVSSAFFEHVDLASITNYLKNIKYKKSIISSVRSDADTVQLKSVLKNCLDFKQAFIPLKISYKSINTLGSDRIANVIAAGSKTQTNVLVLDIGTCIKFDFINSNKVYEGGSISPGIHLRYKSLNDYTGKLPLLHETSKPKILGKSTKECIHFGILNGIQGEINYLIDHYMHEYSDLTIFVTGGDAKYFDYSEKSNIFVVENLTLFGLSLILKAND